MRSAAYWQIRWAANIDMKVLALASFSRTGRYQEALFVHGDLLDGPGIQKANADQHGRKGSDVQIVGDELCR